MDIWMLPGQGAQKVGMGADLLVVPEVAETFELARAATGVDAAWLAEEGTEADIDDALNSQVITAALSVGIARALMARGARPDALVGFSLGQISALMVSGTLSLEEGFALLNERARALADACESHPGAMLALLAASHEDAQEICDTCAQGDVLVCANYNAPGQVVVSGTVEAISRAEAAWKERSKRCARLRTAGAFHSPLMGEAADRVGRFCEQLSFVREDAIPVICNTDARPFDIDQAADRLACQVKSPVRFEQSIAALAQQGATRFVEVGFGGVLTGLVKRIDRSAERLRVGTFAEWEEELVGIVS